MWCLSAGGSGGRPTSDAHEAEAPPELPGLVALGSSHDDVVPGRSTNTTVDTRPMARVSLSADDVENARAGNAALRGHQSAADSRQAFFLLCCVRSGKLLLVVITE